MHSSCLDPAERYETEGSPLALCFVLRLWQMMDHSPLIDKINLLMF